MPETVNYSEIKTIVFAFDYFNHDTVPLQWLMQFSKALDCRITILLGVGQPYSHELEEAVREKQRPILSLYQDNDRIDFITLFGENMVDLIDNYTDCYPPDLLAFCAEPRTMMENLFHTSLIKAVGKEATFPHAGGKPCSWAAPGEEHYIRNLTNALPGSDEYHGSGFIKTRRLKNQIKPNRYADAIRKLPAAMERG
ncbi:MAG: hypothetical protein WDN75_19460 [Bacteroidota bacterium]